MRMESFSKIDYTPGIPQIVIFRLSKFIIGFLTQAHSARSCKNNPLNSYS